MRHWLPEIVALPLLPLLFAQGRRTRRITPRLPVADGPGSGTAVPAHPCINPVPLKLLAIGESPVAGVGVATHEDAITGQLARALAQRLARPVIWQALGQNGANISHATEALMPLLPTEPIDVALIAFGVNDSTEFRTVARYRAALEALLNTLRDRLAPGLIVISGVPPLHVFPSLPQPLRYVLGLKGKALDRAALQVGTASPDTIHAPMPMKLTDRAFMASDGYHPSALGAALWAEHLVEALL